MTLIARLLIAFGLLLVAEAFRALYEHLMDKYKQGALQHWVADRPWLEQWTNPEVSWRNKYALDNTWIGPVAGPLLSGPLVFITDARHFSKFMMTLFVEFAVLVGFNIWPGEMLYWVSLAILALGQGFVFELLYGRVLMINEAKAVSRFRYSGHTSRATTRRKRTFGEWARDNYRVIFITLLPLTYVLSYLVFTGLGGCVTTDCFNSPQGDWGLPSTAAAIVVVVGLFLSWYVDYRIRNIKAYL